jgi:hypothetical protein
MSEMSIKDLYENVLSNFTYNGQKTRINPVTMNSRVEKQIVVQSCNGMNTNMAIKRNELLIQLVTYMHINTYMCTEKMNTKEHVVEFNFKL